MKTDLGQTIIRNHRTGKISFMLSLFPIIYVIGISIKDIFFPILDSKGFEKYVFIEASIVLLVNLIGIIFGAISLSKSEHKKTLGILGIIINAILPVCIILSILIK